MLTDLVPDAFWLDDGGFVAPRDGHHPAALDPEFETAGDWKKLQRRWAIPAHRAGLECWGDNGDEDGRPTVACETCGCFTVVSLAEARRLSPVDRQPVWWFE